MGIESINPFELPIYNTIILLSSGITVTYAHHVRGRNIHAVASREAVYFPNIYTTLELGKGENPELNIASLEKASKLRNLLRIIESHVVFSKVKAVLLKVYYSLFPSIGNSQDREGTIGLLRILSDGLRRRESLTGYIRNILKNKSKQPKESIRACNITPGLPKESNFYGNRTTVVPVLYITGNAVRNRERVVANSALRQLSYSTGCASVPETNITNKLKDLFLRSQSNPEKVIDRNLYKLICDIGILKLAYKNLRSKPGQNTPGLNPETLDGMSLLVLESIIDKLKTEKFTFQAGIRVQIPKALGGNRPLTVAFPRDKLVQEAMRLILEAIYEPTFYDSSHGFRPQARSHTALRAVKQQFQTAN